MWDSEVVNGLNVVAQEKSGFTEALDGAYAVSVRLNDGFDYGDYTVKVEGTNDEFEVTTVDEDKFFFLENSEGNVPNEITVVITEKGTNKTQQVTLQKFKI